MIPPSSYSHLYGPLVAFGALLVICLLCRWVFATPHRAARPARAARERGGDYGLLVPVATVRTRDDADMLCGVLRGAGIRCTVTQDGDAAALLVFRQDALRARELVSS